MRMAYDINIDFVKNKPKVKIIQDDIGVYSLNVVVEHLKVETKECYLVNKICEAKDLKEFERFADLILEEVDSRRDYEKNKGKPKAKKIK
jgi:hypothetical protein